jgi:hypothetical protein
LTVNRFTKPTCWIALLACGGLAWAARADGPAPDPRVLGLTESMLSYCTKLDQALATPYQEKIRQLIQGASVEVLAKVRSSEEYQRARQSMDDFVSKVDEHNAKRVCSNGLAAHR